MPHVVPAKIALSFAVIAVCVAVWAELRAQEEAPAEQPAPPLESPAAAPEPPGEAGQAPADAEVLVTPPPPPGGVPPPVLPEPPPTSAPEPAPEAPEADIAGGVAGYFPGEGFAIKSADLQFKLRMGLQVAYRLEPRWRDGESLDRRTFFVARPFLSGHIFEEWVRFWTSFEFASNPPFLLDSYVEIMPISEFGVRIGQQYSPISRHEYFGPQEILFPEWAPVADYFWPGRDKGVTLLGSLGEGVVDYWLGIYSGTPLRQFTAIEGNWVALARVTVSPLGPGAANEAMYITSEEPVPLRPSFTIQGYAGDVELAIENFNPSTFRFDAEASGESRQHLAGSADIWLQGPRFTALVEGYVRRTDPSGASPAFTSIGVWGQVGYMLVDRILDLGVRVNWLDASTDLSNDRLYSVEGQLGYYPFSTQTLVLKLRYAYGRQNSPGEDALGSVPLVAPEGKYHIATAQLGLAF